MAMLVNLRDSSKIGLGVSLSIMTLLYGIVFSTLIPIPFITGIKKRLIEQDAYLPKNG
jgi:flagellar motor component MotA